MIAAGARAPATRTPEPPPLMAVAPQSTPARDARPPIFPPAPGARLAVVVLTAMNLLNYIDRYVPSAVKDLFKRDLGFTDLQTSLPFSAFVVVYMLASPLFGGLADRRSRKLLIGLGVATWSLATASAALATGFVSFLVARALVGVGEAAYATIGPSLLSDYYPPERRNRIFTIFYMAIPVGAALGFTLGGLLGNAYRWRSTFLICGLPGLAAAGAVMFIREPPRGHLDPGVALATPSWPEALRLLRASRPYVLRWPATRPRRGRVAAWPTGSHVPLPVSRDEPRRGGEPDRYGDRGGRLAGTVAGGLLADWLRGRTHRPYFGAAGRR